MAPGGPQSKARSTRGIYIAILERQPLAQNAAIISPWNGELDPTLPSDRGPEVVGSNKSRKTPKHPGTRLCRVPHPSLLGPGASKVGIYRPRATSYRPQATSRLRLVPLLSIQSQDPAPLSLHATCSFHISSTHKAFCRELPRNAYCDYRE